VSDYLIKIEDTKLKYILSGGYVIQENQEIILSSAIMADGTERRNIAEKRKTTINITFSQIDGITLQNYNMLWQNDFNAEYWSKDDRTYKTGVFRISEKPANSMLNSTREVFDEFEVSLESV
jgi:hypothetical protein